MKSLDLQILAAHWIPELTSRLGRALASWNTAVFGRFASWARIGSWGGLFGSARGLARSKTWRTVLPWMESLPVFLNPRSNRESGMAGLLVCPAKQRFTPGSLPKVGWVLILQLLLGVSVSESQEVGAKDPVIVDRKTDEIIRGALKWLASQQQPNGSWGSSGEEKSHPIAITGYTLMAFQAAGQLPGEGEYGRQVSAGVKYLLDANGPDGLFTDRNSGQYMYGHGVAAIALAEAYGQVRAPSMRDKLEKIIQVIIASQNREGGWRYRPVANDADISVSVLQVVALRSAKNGGLNVPQTTIDNAVQYVKRCYHERSGGFAYQPGREAGFARTAAAIYSLQVCGAYEDKMVMTGSKYLLENQKPKREWFTYGNFYAAPAQYMIGGETWRKWYDGIHKILMDAVKKKGDVFYWETGLDQGRGGVGAIYCTSVYTMILAMPYHYIPLYQR